MEAGIDVKLVTQSLEAPPAESSFLIRIRLRARRRVLWMRALWESGLTAADQGLAISHGEVDRALSDPGQVAAAEASFYRSDPEARELLQSVAVADARAAEDPAWAPLREEFGLSDTDTDLLSLAAAVELDPGLRRVCGYLHDDATACYATQWLAAARFQWPPGTVAGPESSLVRWGLARPLESANNPWGPTAPWIVDPHVVMWLNRGTRLDPALGRAVFIVAASESKETLCLYPAELAGIGEFVGAVRRRRGKYHEKHAPAIEIELLGPEGAGKETLAAQLSAQLGAD